MDEQLARKLLRNVRILNVFIVFFSLMIITIFAVAGVLTYKILTEVRKTKDSFTSLETKAQDNLDLKNQLCSSGGSLRALLDSQTDICN